MKDRKSMELTSENKARFDKLRKLRGQTVNGLMEYLLSLGEKK